MVSDFRPHESYQFFLQEVPELLQTLEEGLLHLQDDHSLAKIHLLMRAAHSLKGGAACVGLHQIQALAHSLETVFKTCSETAVSIDLELENLILKAFDCLKMPLLEEMQTGQSDGLAATAIENPVWQKLATKLAFDRPTAPLEPQQFFAKDIEKGLQRLRDILAQPEEITTALQIQLDILQGLGEIAQIDQLKQLSNTALTALKQDPSSAHAIGRSLLEELHQCNVLVQFDRTALDNSPPQAWLVNSASQTLGESDYVQAKSDEETLWWSEPFLEGQPNTLVPTESNVLIPTPMQPATSRSMGGHQEGARFELLSNLVGELVTQDNRFRSQREQQIETIDFLTESFNRVQQLAISLNRWAQQQPVLPTDVPKQTRRVQSRGQAYLQSTTQAIVEELAQFGEAIQDLMLLDQRLQQIDKQKQKNLKQVQSSLFQAQMLPVSKLLNQFPRMVRDMATTAQKPVTVELKGTQTLVDKTILEKLYDPLVHLVRNAFDHGIEPPEVRQVLGKPLPGKITIRAWHRGNQTYLEVQDDGQGIDVEQVRATAIGLNLIAPEAIESLPPHRLYDYLFAPGFSTTTAVSDLSGRGMGLYAVQAQIHALKGVVTVNSKLGKGSTFTLRLPLALTITRLLEFSMQDNLLAIPVETLAAITVASEQLFQTENGQQFYHWQGHFVPIYPEALLLTYRYPRVAESNDKQLDEEKSWQKTPNFPLLLLSHGEDMLALKVNQILLEQDMMIKPFNDAITPPAGLSGCTILADGRLAPVLDGPALVEKWRQLAQMPIDSVTVSTKRFPAIPKILIADDSLTIRHALSTTLGKAGYQVVQAKDGWEALAQLRLHTDIAAIICDIEMPRMNGLEVLSRCRQQAITLPIIMLTYRSSEKYRQLAKQLGAAAYLTKPYLDKELLVTLETCLVRP